MRFEKGGLLSNGKVRRWSGIGGNGMSSRISIRDSIVDDLS